MNTPSKHFALGEFVKRPHTAPEKVVGVFVYDDGEIALTLRAVDGSVSHVMPVALNRNGLTH